MRFKLVPPAPESIAFVADAQRAVPLVPGTEDDCCARLMRRLDLPSRDVARTWLTFLRALELAVERDSGFVRLSQDPTQDQLAAALFDNVYGAQEVYDLLGVDPLDSERVAEQFETQIPEWERHKDPTGWRETWHDRVEHLLDWFVLFNRAEHRPNGYTRRDNH